MMVSGIERFAFEINTMLPTFLQAGGLCHPVSHGLKTHFFMENFLGGKP